MVLYGYETQDDIPNKAGTDGQPCSAALPTDAGVPHHTPVEMLHAAADGIRAVWRHLVDLGEADHIADRVPSSLISSLDRVVAKVRARSAPTAAGEQPASQPAPPDVTTRQRIASLMAEVLTEASRAMAYPADASTERVQAALAMVRSFEPLLASIPIARLDPAGLDIVNRNCIGLLARLAPHSHPGFKTQEQDHAYQTAADRITQRFLEMQRDNVRFAIDTGRGFDEILTENPRQSVRRLARDVGWKLKSLQLRRDFYLAVGEMTDDEIDEAIDLAVQHGIIGGEMFPDMDEMRDFIMAHRQRITGHPAPMDRRVANARSRLQAATRA